MKRETSRWLMGFSISFGVTFLAMIVVLGGVCLVSYTRAGAAVTGEEKPAGFLPDTYLPTVEDRLILLAAGTAEEGQPPDSYLLLGFLPDKGKIALCVLPPSTYLEYGGQGTTIQRMWQQGGLGYAQKGLADYLDIPIHRRVSAGPGELDALMAYGGPLDYQLTVDLDYPVHGRQVVMPRGRYQLDGRRVMDIIAYPAYQGGERERSDRAALILSKLITQSLPLFLGEEGEALQETALTVLDTDLSAADCLSRSKALEFLAKLDLPATTAVFIAGSLSKNYTVYHLTQDCKERIREMFREPGYQGKPIPEDALPVLEEPVSAPEKPADPPEPSLPDTEEPVSIPDETLPDTEEPASIPEGPASTPEEPADLSAEGPIPDEEKPSPVDSGTPPVWGQPPLDSGLPPIQEQTPLESPFG